MVFHTKSKRRDRAKPHTEAKTKTTFLDLPDELVLNILERTDGISEVLRLRQASKAFVPACSSIIRKELKTLYIHPGKSSVKRAIAICESDLASRIEEICFVNKIRWDKIRAPVHLNKKFGHSWPGLGINERKNELNSDFAVHYEKLLALLASLPTAKTLSFRDTCGEPGFNMTSKQAIENWASTVLESSRKWDAMAERRRLTRLQKVEAKLYGESAYSKEGFNFSDLDAVVAVLSCLNITTLKLTEELPFGSERSLATASLGHLTHIESLVHLGWQASAWQKFCNELLRNAAPALQNLKLSFKHNPAAMWRRTYETSLATIVGDINFPRLRFLELRALEYPEKLPYVPQTIDFMAFLSRCKSLQLFRTCRVVPTSDYIRMSHLPDDYPTMGNIFEKFEGETRVIEELDVNTKAWEISQ